VAEVCRQRLPHRLDVVAQTELGPNARAHALLGDRERDHQRSRPIADERDGHAAHRRTPVERGESHVSDRVRRRYRRAEAGRQLDLQLARRRPRRVDRRRGGAEALARPRGDVLGLDAMKPELLVADQPVAARSESECGGHAHR
jgi:hypothetical protein